MASPKKPSSNHGVCIGIYTLQVLGRIYPPCPPHLLSDHLGHYVSGVDVDGADSHDLLPIARRELPNQHGDEGVELGHLFLVVLLHGVVIALLQTGERHADVRCPPDLSAGQRHLNQRQ